MKLVEQLPQIDAQSTSMVCGDVVAEIGDLYRLYLALNYIRKPIVTGAFRTDTWWVMKEMLSAVAGGDAALAAQADRRVRRLPVAAAALERPDVPEPDRLRAGRHPGRAGVDAARRRHRARSRSPRPSSSTRPSA